MKKRTFVIGIGLIIFVILLYYNQGHFLSSNICGSGMHGLKQMGLYYFIVILLIIVLFMLFNKKTHRTCYFCKVTIDETWKICPYCGKDILKGDEANI